MQAGGLTRASNFIVETGDGMDEYNSSLIT
jgi:hypothetical protein